MKLLFVVLVAVCIVAVHSSPFGVSLDTACPSEVFLHQAGWVEKDGKMSHKFTDSQDAKECRNLAGDNTCDTFDKILTCMRNKGLITAAIDHFTGVHRALPPH